MQNYSHFILAADFAQELTSTAKFWVISLPFIVGGIYGSLTAFKKTVGESLMSFIKKLTDSVEKVAALEKSAAVLPALHDQVKSIYSELHPPNGPTMIEELQGITAERMLEFELDPRPMFECDALGNNTRVNKAYCELFSLTAPAQAMRFNWAQFLHENDCSSYVEAWKRSWTTGSTFHRIAKFVDAQQNEIGYLQVSALPMFSKTNNTLLKYRGFVEFAVTQNS